MMMRFFLTLILITSFGIHSKCEAADAPSTFLALCYHNVEDKDPDQLYDGITTSKLIEQISWLQDQGYQAVSIDDLLKARQGIKPLPAKAFLLSFDDGYESFYTRVYPVLRAFHVPAVLAVVDAWLKGTPGVNGNAGDKVLYGDVKMPRDFFLTWDQIREMDKSGLVEVASHSDALHYGISANPQGNFEPAVITTTYDAKTKTYETAKAYEDRLNKDAAASVKKIRQEIGHSPRVMVWPYGAYNQVAINIQQAHGMPVTLSLDDGVGRIEKLQSVPRYLVNDDPAIGDFAVAVREITKPSLQRVVQVDLDYVYDVDPDQMSQNIDALINRIYKMQISTVFLQAFADPKGTGLARELYFPNRYLPMRADLFNRVARQLATRAHVSVYGWLPVLSFDFGTSVAPVLTWNPETKTAEVDPKAYHRASPFDPEARERILGIYEDMARQAPLAGLLFHDDALLTDFEDASAPALAAYGRAGLPVTIDALRADTEIMKKWTDFKTETLIEFTQELSARVAHYRSPLITVRNIYASLLLHPESQEWFAENYDRFLASYDYTAVMAMPAMENVDEDDADAWLQTLIEKVAARPDGLKKTIFELQSVDWRKETSGDARAIPTETLAREMRLLATHGALNFGYYPDDFVTNTPDAGLLHKDFSLQSYLYLP